MRVHDVSRGKTLSACEPVSFGLFGQQQCRGSTQQTLRNMYSRMRVIALCTDDPVRHFMYLPLRLQTVRPSAPLPAGFAVRIVVDLEQPTLLITAWRAGTDSKAAGLTHRRLCRGDRTECSEAPDRTEIPVVRIHVSQCRSIVCCMLQCTNSRDKCRTPQVRFLRPTFHRVASRLPKSRRNETLFPRHFRDHTLTKPRVPNRRPKAQ